MKPSDVEECKIDTPFGSPSDALILGSLEGTRSLPSLARRSRNHTLCPPEKVAIPRQYAMKQLGVEYLISSSWFA